MLLLLASTQIVASKGRSLGDSIRVEKMPYKLSDIIRIKDVLFARRASSAQVSFATSQPNIPTVDISTAPPIVNNDGSLTFRPKDAVRGYNAGLGAKTLQHSINLYGLEPATTYHYIITARSDKPEVPLGQETGSFTTVSQRVKVVLESIKILITSDDDGTDELVFRLWANADWPSKRFVDVPPFLMSSSGDLGGSGDGKALRREMIVNNAPDELILQADGYDDDSHTFNSAFNPFTDRPLPGTGSNGNGNWSVASVTIDLNKYPSPAGQRTATGYFEITTPRTGTPHELRFRVRGSFEITRPPAYADGIIIGSVSETGKGSSRIGDIFKNLPGGAPSAPAPSAPGTAAPGSAYVYAITPDGRLQWRRHNGAANGGGPATLQNSVQVGHGWTNFRQVFAAENGLIYTISDDGTLNWYQHNGFKTGAAANVAGSWSGPREVASGWDSYKNVFSGGGNVIYAITQEGNLLWFRHKGAANGTNEWEGPRDIADNWANFKQVFSTGEGVLYAVTEDGKLLWHKHTGYADGAKTWAAERQVGHGWDGFKSIFSSGDGVIYVVTPDDKLMWYRHNGWREGTGANVTGAWSQAHEVGTGWGDFDQVFALLSPATSTRVRFPRRGTSGGVRPGDEVTLNPQPLPPKAGEKVILNPQPLPPRVIIR
ncbi:MAG TPA: tachylectin-related carbohydrate-binding protein [Abditibacteriaceae bacterium]